MLNSIRSKRIMSKLRELAIRLAGFSASTVAGFLVDNLVLWVCSTYLFKGTYFREVILSPTISFEFAVITNFLIAYYFVWKDRVSSRTVRSFFRHLGGYNLSSVGGFIIKMGVLMGIKQMLGWNVVFCNMLAVCVSGGLNFALNEWVVFGKRKKKDGAA